MSNDADYRTSAWSLRDALAPASTLGELEARPMRRENAAAIAVARFTGDASAERKSGQALIDLGFRHLGTKTEAPEGRTRPPLDVFYVVLYIARL